MRIPSTVKRVFCMFLVFLAGVNASANLMALTFDCSPKDGEVWKIFLSLFFACMFGFYALQDKDIEL